MEMCIRDSQCGQRDTERLYSNRARCVFGNGYPDRFCDRLFIGQPVGYGIHECGCWFGFFPFVGYKFLFL